jgi:release factor glutamine methyltransferase
LLLDGLYHEFEQDVFQKMVHPLLVEIGCGSGVANVFLASQFLQPGRNSDPTVIVTDINPRALQVTQATAAAAVTHSGATPIRLEAIQCDLLSALLPRLKHAVDILIFNPPYVPTPDDEVGSTGIEASWAGGVKGRRVIDRAIPQMAQILAQPEGVAYMITVDDNEPELLAVEFEKLGLKMTPLVRRRAHNEYLTVQKLTWIVGEKPLNNDGEDQPEGP